MKTKKSTWITVALAGVLLLLLYLGFHFLRSGGPGRPAPTGPWALDKDAVALAPGDLALEFRGNNARAENMRAWIKAGTWKIVEKKGQTLTVEISSPEEFSERLEITVGDGDHLPLSPDGGPLPLNPDDSRVQSSPVKKPTNLKQWPGPRPLRPLKEGDQQGSAQTGSSSQQGANYSLIEKGLYQGGLVSAPPPGTEAVINLCETLDRYQSSVPFYQWVPIADAPPAPSLNWLKQMVSIVDAKRQSGETIYVHCRAGISRSGMVVTAYCMFEHHWTRDRALEFVRSKRPKTNPNPAFMKLLSEWELHLQKQSSTPGPGPRVPVERARNCRIDFQICPVRLKT